MQFRFLSVISQNGMKLIYRVFVWFIAGCENITVD